MNKFIVSFIGLLIISLSCWASIGLKYGVTFDIKKTVLNVDLKITTDGQDKDQPLTLKLPVWAPGYYIILDYPKNLYDFSAADKDGNPIAWTKVGKTGWQVTPQDGELHVSYKVLTDAHSVAEGYLNEKEAFVAPNGVFMYVDGRKELPLEVSFQMPDGWKQASTSLKLVGNNEGKVRTFAATNIDVLYDSPILFGNHYVKKFTHEGHGYEFAITCPEGLEDGTFEADFKKMVSSTTQLMGDVPYDNYCMIHLGAGGGGLEHLSSQACYTGGTYKFRSRADYLRHLTFVTHEYYHLYNVKAIRPFELGPFDYDHEVFTPMLWVSEGFTCYYEIRNLLTAGIVDGDFLLASISDEIKTVETSEGHKHMSLRQSSYDIWLNFFNRNSNSNDVTISYYNKGPVIALLFDIELRYATDGQRGVDDLMRLLYNRFYKQQDRGFTEEEFWQCTDEIAGKPMEQLHHYVDTTDDIDYDTLLAHAGLGLHKDTWKLYRLAKADKQQKKLRQLILCDK